MHKHKINIIKNTKSYKNKTLPIIEVNSQIKNLIIDIIIKHYGGDKYKFNIIHDKFFFKNRLYLL